MVEHAPVTKAIDKVLATTAKQARNLRIEEAANALIIDRARYAAEVYDVLIDGTESFEESGIGVELAYLMAAILKGEFIRLDDTIPRHVAFMRLLLDCFSADALVWANVELFDSEHGDLNGRDARNPQDTDVRCLVRHDFHDGGAAHLKNCAWAKLLYPEDHDG